MFLFDKTETYSYDRLLKEVNERDSYFPLLQTSKIFDYFVNFVKALVCNQSIILIDSDMNPSEIESIDSSQINVPIKIGTTSIASMNDVIKAVMDSTSEITLFTSGTTGQPKKVIHSVSTLTRYVRTGDKYNGQIWAYAYNPTHMAGIQVFFQAFANQNTLVNVFNQSRDEVYQQIENKGITHISATPTFYRLLLPYEKSFSSVIRVTFGGEKSDHHLYESIQRIFPNAKINNVYASTEAGSLFAAKGDAFQIPATIKNLIKVVDDELLIHKSLLGTSDSFHYDDDFYHSGDLIEWINQEDGLFKFKSRKNELINVGGYKVNPGEVENVILDIDGIKQAYVYGKANSILGNVLCADVVLQENTIVKELDIRQRLEKTLQSFKIPRRIKFVERIELTRTGKQKRK